MRHTHTRTHAPSLAAALSLAPRPPARTAYQAARPQLAGAAIQAAIAHEERADPERCASPGVERGRARVSQGACYLQPPPSPARRLKAGAEAAHKVMLEIPKGKPRKDKLKKLVKEDIATPAAIAKAGRSDGGTHGGSCLCATRTPARTHPP